MKDMLLRIDLPKQEICIDSKSKDPTIVADIIQCEAVTIVLEHSLYTISIWESITHKAYLKQTLKEKDLEDYLRCMIISPEEITEADFIRLTRNPKYMNQIMEYLNDKKSASVFFDTQKENQGSSSDIMTSDVLYYSIFSLQMPMEVEHWHLNKLMAVLRVFETKNPMKKNKRTTKSIMQDYDRINEARKQKLGTKG